MVEGDTGDGVADSGHALRMARAHWLRKAGRKKGLHMTEIIAGGGLKENLVVGELYWLESEGEKGLFRVERVDENGIVWFKQLKYRSPGGHWVWAEAGFNAAALARMEIQRVPEEVKQALQLK